MAVDVTTLADLKAERVPAPPRLPALSSAELASIAAERHQRDVELRALAMELSARHPYDAAGLMDFYQPGRWDTSTDLVYMTSDFDGNAAAGYVQYTAPTGGDHLVAVSFTGYQTTLRVWGPWGMVSAYSDTTSSNAVATALWNGAAGASLYFNFSFTGGIIGYLRSVRIHQL